MIGKTIGQYQVIDKIGEGGMGEVYLANDTSLDRKVALKFLPQELKQDPSARKRFLREAKAAAALDHPFICKIYDTGEVNDNIYIVMEYISGENLSDKIEKGILPLSDSLRIALETAEALEMAHEKGIVHRDLKPANIMVTPQGHVKVMDFGIARRFFREDNKTQIQPDTTLTQEGIVLGTLAYMSPEQARGQEVDKRSDIFSLGIILHEMTSGEHPFARSNPVEILSAILRDKPPSVVTGTSRINTQLSHILLKSLAKDLNERYQDVRELVADVRRIQGGGFEEARWFAKGWSAKVATVIIIVSLLVGTLWFARRGAISTTEAAPEPISVLIADFYNRTNDPVFDGALEQILSIGLEGASFISSMERADARSLAAQLDPSAEGTLDEKLAQLVSRSAGINLVLAGSIEPKGAGFEIHTWVVDPVTSDRLFEASRTIDMKANVLKAADGLATELRLRLGDLPAESRQALSEETYTTSSLEAMHAYAHARELEKQGNAEEAIAEYLNAIEKDEHFGRAYAGLAVIYFNRGQYQEGERYHQMAMVNIDRMTDREKYRTRGIYYLMVRDYQKAIEVYEALVSQFPVDSAGWGNLALAYFFARDLPKAVEVNLRMVELKPQDISAHYNQVWYALAVGDFEMVEQESDAVLEINSSFDQVYLPLALSQLAQGRAEDAAAVYRQLESMNPWGASMVGIGLADLAIYEGRLTDAVAILEESISNDVEQGFNDTAAEKRVILASILISRGHGAIASEHADQAVAAGNKLSVMFLAARVYLRASREDKALRLISDLSGRFQAEPQAYAKLIEGEIKLRDGNSQAAIRLFREANELVDTWLGRFALGRAYVEAGAFIEAHSELELCLSRKGEATSVFFEDTPTYRIVPPVHYYLGRAKEGLNSPGAAESYRTYLHIKKNADTDPLDPIIEDIRRRLGQDSTNLNELPLKR